MDDIKDFFADTIHVFRTESIVGAIGYATLLAMLLSMCVTVICGLLYCLLIASWEVHWLVGLTIDICFIAPFVFMAYAKLSNKKLKEI